MEPLKTNKLLLIWLGMCEADQLSSKTIKIAQFGVCATILTLNLFSMISNIVFLAEFVSTDLNRSIFAFMNLSGYLGMFYTLISAFNLRHEINEIFVKLAGICCKGECHNDTHPVYLVFHLLATRHESRAQSLIKYTLTCLFCVQYNMNFRFHWVLWFTDEDAVSMQILQKSDDRSEWLRLIYIWYLISAFFSTVVLSVISVVVCWLIKDHLDVAYLYHPLMTLV